METGDAMSSVSHAMGQLYQCDLATHPVRRNRYWAADMKNPVIRKLEKFLFISKNSPEINALLAKKAVCLAAAHIYSQNGVANISSLMDFTGLSRATVLTALDKLYGYGLLDKPVGKPFRFHLKTEPLAALFYEICNDLSIYAALDRDRGMSSEGIIEKISSEDSVLVLVQYGSSIRDQQDMHSDIDLLVVARDKWSRGEILSRYAKARLDLNVYSKAGFLQLLKAQPDFVHNLAKANIIKGKDILEAVLP